ncbi:RagB/SusD family nutrient uptake outer membrane protein [Prolixibacteraceae bacterium Z1-6]|uniref:RagB/SusD family nutrient uptake outer membrane protein n=1 Tax=Draconibacterium aestuarii TaxID=2998507 RepID=A0A9X3FG26_9BACT|nr:RagB/SusD family nutrient uptake outer membrane protein [Prolixibacteraceae bacterium Z1-6]
MMKNNKITIIGLIFSILLFSGCEDLLKEDVYSELDPDGLFNNEIGAEAVLYSAYAEASLNDHNGKSFLNLEEWCTDIEWETGGGENQTAVQMINFTWDASTGWITDLMWRRPYRGVRNANTILDNIDESTLPDASKKLIKAEARFVRATEYYYMYTSFGPVPLRTSAEEELELTRATEEEMMTFLETEFSEIILDLPAPGSEKLYGRAHKGAAAAFLCKFYLTTKQWQKCADAAEDVMGMGYELYPDFRELFKVENERNDEYIWVHQAVIEAPGNLYINGAFPIGFAVEPKSGFIWTSNMRNWAAQYRLYDSFYNSFEEGDQRKELIISEYINKQGETVSLLNANNTRSFKFWPDVNAQANHHGNDIPQIRYADILLARAEALNELNGPNQESIDLINKIRNRANLDDIAVADFGSKEALRDHILKERGWEFYSERKRRQDLIRHDKFISSAQERGITNAQAHHVRMPIPQIEIDANPLCEQNPGY